MADIDVKAVQHAMALLEQTSADNRERQHAYEELVNIAARMAEKLGPNDPDTLALEALFAFQAAESAERLARLRALNAKFRAESREQ